MTPREAATVI